MTTIEEVMRMQKSGKTDKDIVIELSGRGFPLNEISEALSQTRIKAAVSQSEAAAAAQSPGTSISESQSEPMTRELESPTPVSLMNRGQPPEGYSQYPYQESAPMAPSPNQQAYLPIPGQGQYQDYGYSAPSYSSDTITEIAEEIVAEKFFSIKEDLEKIIDFKNTVQTKIEYLDERLKRIEKIIDRLQLSILQKVGEYVNSTEDIKKEMVELEKSVKFLAGKHK